MHDGTAPVDQLHRTLPMAEAAKGSGVMGFEFRLESRDARLLDKTPRQETGRFLFVWAVQAGNCASWTRQASWR